MKFVCELCSAMGDLERFRVDGAALVVTCPACGGENRVLPRPRRGEGRPEGTVTPLRPAAVDDQRPFEVPAGHCPKCISKRSENAPACPACGLVFSTQATDAFNPSEWLKLEWLRLLQTWEDEPRHEALRVEALNNGELAEIGRLYRLRLAADPNDAIAQRGRDGVLKLAVQPQVSQQLKTDPSVPRWKYVALSAVILGCLVALFLLVRQMLTLS